MLFCSYVIFLLRTCRRPMNDCKIERSYGRCFGRQQLPAYSNRHSISNEKQSVVTARYLQSIKTFLTLELSRYRKSGSTFSSSEPAATAADSETPCVCARPSDPRQPCRRAAPRAWPLILPSIPLIVFWNSLLE